LFYNGLISLHPAWIFLAILTRCFVIQQRRLRISERLSALQELLPHSAEVIYLSMEACRQLCIVLAPWRCFFSKWLVSM